MASTTYTEKQINLEWKLNQKAFAIFFVSFIFSQGAPIRIKA